MYNVIQNLKRINPVYMPTKAKYFIKMQHATIDTINIDLFNGLRRLHFC